MRAGDFGIEQKNNFLCFFRSYKLIPNLLLWIAFFRKKENPSLIHINISRIIIPLIAAKIMGIPTIVHFRDVPSMMRYKPTIGWYLYYRIMNFSKYWIANSTATRKDILSKQIKGKVTTLFNFLDLKAFDKNADFLTIKKIIA